MPRLPRAEMTNLKRLRILMPGEEFIILKEGYTPSRPHREITVVQLEDHPSCELYGIAVQKARRQIGDYRSLMDMETTGEILKGETHDVPPVAVLLTLVGHTYYTCVRLSKVLGQPGLDQFSPIMVGWNKGDLLRLDGSVALTMAAAGRAGRVRFTTIHFIAPSILTGVLQGRTEQIGRVRLAREFDTQPPLSVYAVEGLPSVDDDGKGDVDEH